MDRIAKRFLYLFCSQWKWARKLHGGRWVIPKGGTWVTWNAQDIPFGLFKSKMPWPLESDEFICEEYTS